MKGICIPFISKYGDRMNKFNLLKIKESVNSSALGSTGNLKLDFRWTISLTDQVLLTNKSDSLLEFVFNVDRFSIPLDLPILINVITTYSSDRGHLEIKRTDMNALLLYHFPLSYEELYNSKALDSIIIDLTKDVLNIRALIKSIKFSYTKASSESINEIEDDESIDVGNIFRQLKEIINREEKDEDKGS